MEKKKIIANTGVKRNKKPLQNIIYEIDIVTSLKGGKEEDYTKYMFKDLGFLWLHWKYEKDIMKSSHGFITPEDLKNRIGEKQWAKFCSGKRTFIVQRRVDGKNI